MMKNKKRKLVTIGLIVTLFLGLSAIIFPLTSCNGQLLDRILANKIVFHGQVLDLDGNPVPNAKITYSGFSAAHYENAWTGGGPPNKIKYADENGCFEIRETGGSLYVNCTHPEYYGSESSVQKFGYGLQVGNEPAWDSQNPAIFRLRKKGIREPLYFSCGEMINKGNEWIALGNGERIVIDLARGRRRETDTSIYISYQCEKDKDQERNYDWEYTLRIPGGGFIEKQENFDFIAPEDGYQEEIKIGYLKDDKSWNYFKRCFYFVKFPNGLYGIFEISAESRRRGVFLFQALINPNPASRNLEYEYEKQINKTQGYHRYMRLL